MKPDSHKVIYGTGNLCTQVDYILTRRSDLKQVHNVKLIGDVLPNITVLEESIDSSTLLSAADSEPDVKSFRTEIKSCLINVSDSVCD